MPGSVRADSARVGPVDVVLVAVETTTRLGDVSPWLSALCDDNTVVCTLQNGIEHVELVQPHCPSSPVAPAISRRQAKAGADRRPRLILPDSGAMVADLLHEAGCIVDVVEDFTTPSWRELSYNAVGGLMALFGWHCGMLGTHQ